MKNTLRIPIGKTVAKKAGDYYGGECLLATALQRRPELQGANIIVSGRYCDINQDRYDILQYDKLHRVYTDGTSHPIPLNTFKPFKITLRKRVD